MIKITLEFKRFILIWVGNGSTSHLNHLCIYSISDCYFCSTLKKGSLSIRIKSIVLNTNEICVVFVNRVIKKCHRLSSVISSSAIINILTDLDAAIFVSIVCPASGLIRVPHTDHVDVQVSGTVSIPGHDDSGLSILQLRGNGHESL